MSFVKRTTLKDLKNGAWYRYACQRTGVPMPNCFTYACARISEILGKPQALDAIRVRGAGDLWEQHAPEFTCSQVAQTGALMIWKGGNGNYGHVAVCEGIAGANIIEWSESNFGGSEFCFVSRNPNGYAGLRFMGYLIHRDLAKDTPENELHILNRIPADFVYEKAKFTCNVDKINIRKAPSLQGILSGDWYGEGMSVYYDGYVKREGYLWISWISMKSGQRQWMAAGKLNAAGINVQPYGKFG